MGQVVTGIVQTFDLGALDKALRDAGLAPARASVLSREYESDGPIGSDITVIDPGLDAVTSRGDGIITGGGGTGVPGLTSGSGQREFFREHGLADQISDLEIPDSVLDNYVEAVEAGRTIVVYYAEGEERAAAETAFNGLGYANVRTYGG